MSSNRWLAAGGIALVLLVAGSIAVGRNRGSETEFPPGSPEGTVQRYVRAVEEQDANALRALLSPETQQRCELADIRNALRYPTERDLRVTLRDAKVNDGRAEVRVRVTESSGGAGPFDSGSFDHDETFDLVRFNNDWLIDQPTWPIYCPPKVPPIVVTPTPASTTPTPEAATATPGAR